jgi:hypothetical protein
MKRLHRGVAAACAAIALLAVCTPASAVVGPNLLVNGGAEGGDPSLSGFSAVSIPGWQVSGTPTVIPYGTAGGFPTQSQGPADGGNQFFGGGDAGDATLSQRVDLSSAAAEIDAGAVPFTLSGWLGGSQKDRSDATVTVRFLDASSQQLGSAASIGPVTRADRQHKTELLPRSTTGTVPVGARSASVVVSFTDRNGDGYNDGFADDVSLTVGAELTALPLTPPTSNVGQLDHVFVVYMEDKGNGDIVGNSLAPYINSLINAHGFASDYHALTYPSDPNYISLLGGSDFGIHTDCSLSCMVDEPNLLDNLEAAGKSWAFYEESMPSACYQQNAGQYYAPDELPWTYFSDIANNQARCQSHVFPLSQIGTDLSSSATSPNFVWFAANACDNMEKCGIAAGDTWLQQTVQLILNSAMFQDPTQRSVVLVTWDEDQNRLPSHFKNQGNHVPLIVIPSPGAVSSGMKSGHFLATGYYNHYSLLRTIEDALGLPSLTHNDKYATPLNDFWGP